jgi:hypothetical protein
MSELVSEEEREKKYALTLLERVAKRKIERVREKEKLFSRKVELIGD